MPGPRVHRPPHRPSGRVRPPRTRHRQARAGPASIPALGRFTPRYAISPRLRQGAHCRRSVAGQRVSVTVRTAPLPDVRRGRRSGAAGCDAEGGYEQPDDGRGRGEPVWAGEFMSAAASPGDVRLTEVVPRSGSRQGPRRPSRADRCGEGTGARRARGGVVRVRSRCHPGRAGRGHAGCEQVRAA